jgi:TrmH family RNA methyltransferase
MIRKTMTTIASPQNPRLQGVRRLQRRRERARSGRFLAEGEDLIAAAAAAGWDPVEGYRVAGDGQPDLGPGFLEVEPAALAAVSTLGSGTRAIGVYEQRWSKGLTGPLWVYLHGLSDPGNVGSVLRAAHAFAASGVALGPDCADPFSPKAVRASMGAIFTVPLARAASVAELPGERIALVAHAGEPLSSLRAASASSRRVSMDAGEDGLVPDGTGGERLRAPGPDPARPLTLLVGAEREGLPADLVAACEHVAHIPIAGDSLNAATAAAIALYEMTKSNDRGAQLAGLQPAAPPQSNDRGARLVGLQPAAPPSKVPAT